MMIRHNLPRWRKLSRLSLVLLFLIVLVVGSVYVVTAMAYVDCTWSGTARAWLDTNGNGTWEGDEPPLAGVNFVIDDLRNSLVDVGDEAVSDADGAAKLFVWLPGCPSTEFQVYPEAPPGYELTTQARVLDQGDEVFLFGFTQDQ